MSRPIAVFDSGVGGLTLLNEAMKLLPNRNFIYFADSQNVPYGTKNPDDINLCVQLAVQFLSEKNIGLLVLACNTATSVSADILRSKFDFPIIGMEPAIKPAIDGQLHGKIVVLATSLTLKLKKYSNLVTDLKAQDLVIPLEADQLVNHAEDFQFDGPEVRNYLNKKLNSINWDETGYLVLGCTHFVYYKNLLSKMLPNHVQILDGIRGTCLQIRRSTDSPSKNAMTNLKCYFSCHEVDPELISPFLSFLDGTAFGYFNT